MEKKYNREAKTFDEQIKILKDKKLKIYSNSDRNHEILTNMNYFLIFHYAKLMNLYNSETKTFTANTKLKNIYDFYIVDIKLKNIIFDAINLLEKHLRSFFTCTFAAKIKYHHQKI